MQNEDRLRDIRALDYFLFGGVPAVPDPMYSRGDYYTHQAAIRHTRLSSNVSEVESNSINGVITGRVEYDLETDTFVSYNVASSKPDKL